MHDVRRLGVRLTVVMAVRQLEVAEDFVLMTFGLLFGALCLAAALAFGLGSKEVAGDFVKRHYDQRRKLTAPPQRPVPSPPPVAPPSTADL